MEDDTFEGAGNSRKRLGSEADYEAPSKRKHAIEQKTHAEDEEAEAEDEEHDAAEEEERAQRAAWAREQRRHRQHLREGDGGAYAALLEDGVGRGRRAKHGKGSNGLSSVDRDGDADLNAQDGDGDGDGDRDGISRIKDQIEYSARAGRQTLEAVMGEEDMGADVTAEERDALEAFNLEDERRDGFFDADGSYVSYALHDRAAACVDADGRILDDRRSRTRNRNRNRIRLGDDPARASALSDDDADDIDDAWVDDINRKNPVPHPSQSRSRRGAADNDDNSDQEESQNSRAAAQRMQDAAPPKPKIAPKECIAQLLQILQQNETIPKALRRLRPAAASQPKRKASEKPPASAPAQHTNPSKDSQEPTPFAIVTEAADSLLYIGVNNIYELNREQIEGLLSSMGKQRKPAKWLYKWSLDATDIYGPYSLEEMKAWWEQGYFQSAGGIFVKPEGTTTNYFPLQDAAQLE
eukprot:TRINITY_DN3663_c0_g3_i2.p1 TRINITY_DN3663_c0_g3~~TRINITY_DN3663_c0_g3_i2.p1  ORF type:complete len:467 (-),score=113.84 TRINITY_DN3663_c0_g3_i2:243-1643(-)